MSEKLTSSSKIYVAGHRGLAGSAIVRRLLELGLRNLVLKTSKELDLTSLAAVESFFAAERPEFVFLAAGKSGGILANARQPAEFLFHNLAIETNVIHAASKYDVRKLVFLSAACVYPRMASQPIQEDALLTGPLDPAVEPYAIAKIAGLKLAAAYRAQYGFQAISLIPTSLYGPGDNFDPESSHVMAALIHRFHGAKLSKAKEAVVWGTGTPRRDFLHSADLAAASVLAMDYYGGTPPLNVGSGQDISIADLAALVARTVGFSGHIQYDEMKPDGAPQRLLDISHIRGLGWTPRISLEDGVASTYQAYLQRAASVAR